MEREIRVISPPAPGNAMQPRDNARPPPLCATGNFYFIFFFLGGGGGENKRPPKRTWRWEVP